MLNFAIWVIDLLSVILRAMEHLPNNKTLECISDFLGYLLNLLFRG